MDIKAVWRKTPKGQDAIARRAGGLSPRLRSVLIMVDGKRPTADFDQLAAGLGSPEALLSQLASGGFIEAVLPGWSGPLPQAPTFSALTRSNPGPATEPLGLSLTDTKRFAVRQLTDLMGPTAEPLCLRIESAKTAGDLVEHLRRARVVLRDARGELAAQRFENALESQGAPPH